MGALTKTSRRARVRILHRRARGGTKSRYGDRSRHQPLLVIPSIARDAVIDWPLLSAPQGVSQHVAWGLGGFLLGAMFWHLVGFWNFMDTTMTGFAHAGQVVVTSADTGATVRAQTLAENPVRATAAVAMASRPATTPAIAVVAPVLPTGRIASVQLANVDAPNTISNCSELYVDPRTSRTVQRPCDLRSGIDVGAPQPFQTAERTDLAF